jgi:hypothetical protein
MGAVFFGVFFIPTVIISLGIFEWWLNEDSMKEG